MLDDIFDYVEHLRKRPVWEPIPDAVRGHFRETLPTAPSDLASVHDEFLRYVLPFGPGFVTGTSMANLIAVLVARMAASDIEVRRHGVAAGRRLIAYTSAAAHGCIGQAMDVCGLGTDALRMIAVNDRHQIDVAELRRTIDADRRAGFTPFLVVGTAGTVDIGGIDDLSALADLAADAKLWFHVDGAFGALAILAPALAPRLAGIERADSLALDFHKWAQVPYDAGCVIVRDGELHRSTFASPAAYLRRDSRGLAAGSPWPCDFGPDLSRGFRALKTWFTLKVYGTERLGAVIARTCALAQYLRERIEATSATAGSMPIGSMQGSSPICTSPAWPHRRRRPSTGASRFVPPS